MSPNASTPALEAATVFLTRPLVLLGVHSPTTLVALQVFLQSALAPRGHLLQLLSFTTTSLPPLPIQLACVAFGIKWADWLQALGGAAFDLIIEPTRVYVIKNSTGQVGVIWTSRDADVSRAILVSKPPIAPEAELEPESDASDSEFDAPSSRPSSRSSTVSDSAFSSSSRSSHTSVSSISSTKPAPARAPASRAQAPTKYLYHGGVSTVLTGGVMLGGGAAAPPRPSAAALTPARYASAVRTASAAPVPVYTPPHRARAQATSTWARKDRSIVSTGVGSWRRSTAAPVRATA